MKKKIIWGSLIAIVVTLLAIQKVEVTPNNSGIDSLDVMKGFPTSHRVKTLLQTACYDCHSNTTTYPWYSKYQPVGMWLEDHVEDGKRHLNFSQLMTYTSKRKNHKLEEIIETIDENEMPLKSYTLIHHHAVLSDKQKSDVISWVKSVLKK